MQSFAAPARHPSVILDVPSEWGNAADRIRRDRIRRVLVLGPTDAGKSAFCRVLLRAVLDWRLNVGLVDADLGQKIVGPPACVTSGVASSGHDVALSALVFVGTTNPVKGWRDVISGTARLAADSRADLQVINTGGLLAGPGRRLKLDLVEALAPDLIVGIGQDPALDTVLSGLTRLPIIRLGSSALARRKTAGERRAIRREAFRSYFAHATEASKALTELRMERAPAPSAFPPDRLLVGLADAHGRDLGLGIVSGIDPDARRLAVLTPLDLDYASRMRWGTFMLDQDFAERSLAPSSRPSD
jgi:polynucleotide 5'-hydroxyl-kinase GRC3/NOL9